LHLNAVTWRESKLLSVCRSGLTSAGAGTTKFAVLNYWEIEERKSFCRRAVTKKWHRNINGANSNKNRATQRGYSKEVKVNYWINFSMLILSLDTRMLHGVTIFFFYELKIGPSQRVFQFCIFIFVLLKFIEPRCQNFLLTRWIKAYYHLNNSYHLKLHNICMYVYMSFMYIKMEENKKEQCLLQLSCDHRIVSDKYRFTCYIAPEEVKVLFFCVICIEKCRAI
jgi:hypothetical protein